MVERKKGLFKDIFNVSGSLYTLSGKNFISGKTGYSAEAVNSSFRKVTKKGSFPNEKALFKLLYLRVTELYKKWSDSTIQNWSMVRNQLDAHLQFQDRFRTHSRSLIIYNLYFVY